jgi:ParB-like chromosome segregation protein Spo0J
VSQIVESIRRYGQTFPILVKRDGTIFAGEGRYRALVQLGEAKAKVLPVDGWSEDEVREYMIADNKLAINAGWDPEILAAELREMEARGLKPDMLGFSAEEVLRMLDDADEAKLRRLEASGGEKAGDEAPSTPTPDGLERVSFPMLPAHLEILRAALRLCKQRHDVKTSSEALGMICSDWMEASDADDRTTAKPRVHRPRSSARSRPAVEGHAP